MCGRAGAAGVVVVAVTGSAGEAVVADVVARGVRVGFLVLLASLGRLSGVPSGGSLGGGWSPPSCWVVGGVALSVKGRSLHGAGCCKERLRSVRLSSPSWKSSISLLLVGVINRSKIQAMFRCVCSGMWGQMAIPESVVSEPMSLRRVFACGHA